MACHRLSYLCSRNISSGFLRCWATKTPQMLSVLRPRLDCSRGYNKSLLPYLRELYQRRLKVGPERERHRSEWINWNYDAEIYAFGQRLDEEFNEDTLRVVFTDRSYIEKDSLRRQELGVDQDIMPLNLVDNTEMAEQGQILTSRYIKAFLRFSYPAMFEEGICAVHDLLTSEDTLSTTAAHIGMTDLLLTEDFPVSPSTLSTALLALVGGLAQDQGIRRAERFLNHFIVPHLVVKDINELWHIDNPMGLLRAMLRHSDRGEPEPRLIQQSASHTVMSLYWVAIYSDQQMIGKAPGETVTIAEEMAARDSLSQLLKTSAQQRPLVVGLAAEDLQLDYSTVNPSMATLLDMTESHRATVA
ncbi:39S ribosomal protein L44, mitochondrial-like [Argonauta hians]